MKTSHNSPFPDIPVLENGNIRLRKLASSDAQDMFEYSSLPIVTRYISYHHEHISEVEERLRNYEEKYKSGDLMIWGIEFIPDEKLIGVCGFTHWNRTDDIAEIAYTLNPDYWGRGIAGTSVKMLLNFGFDQMQLNRIEARCWVENEASEKVMVSCQMQFEGILREQLWNKEKYRDVKMYSILRKEFIAPEL